MPQEWLAAVGIAAIWVIECVPLSVGSYVDLVGSRCAELHGFHPVGAIGEAWSDTLLIEAKAICDSDRRCAGVMRYIGEQQAHCHDWCGRPQFCLQGTLASFSLNDAWVSAVKSEHLEELGLPSAAWVLGRAWAVHPGVTVGPSGPAAAPLRVGELLRKVDCDRFSASVWRAPPVVLVAAPAAKMPGEMFPGSCRIAYQPFEPGGAELPGIHEAPAIDGVLTEREEEDLPIFSGSGGLATGASTLLDARGRGAGDVFLKYYVDPVHEYPLDRLGIVGEKDKVLSVYFLAHESRCVGPKEVLLSPIEVADSWHSEHVYVEDGTHATRAAAFKHYRFTLLCGDFSSEPFPPQALVYALAYCAFAIVPEFLHWKASRLFFHLPDAAQGYRSLSVANLESHLRDMAENPRMGKLIEFKETFTLLCQQLLWYRYQEPARQRAEMAACALCDARDRELRRQASAPAETAAAAEIPAAAVAVLFCGMSRRGAHVLRRVIRETWGRALTGVEVAAAQRFFVGRHDGEGQGEGDSVHGVEDADVGDIVELPVLESYRTLNVKLFAMLSWVHQTFPNFQWLVRHDDDVYLRAQALVVQLGARPPVRYFWGMFDHGSSPVRDPAHQHFNSYEQFPQQAHPAWGDIFPPYARGLLWAMSADLVGAVVAEFLDKVNMHPAGALYEDLAEQLPHPDDPSVGVIITDLVKKGISINLDDRDFNSFSLNPSCTSTFSNIHNRTWVVHHVKPETMRCMWALDEADGATSVASSGNSAADASQRIFPDLCLCSTEVEEEEDSDPDGLPFWYDRTRFNTAR